VTRRTSAERTAATLSAADQPSASRACQTCSFKRTARKFGASWSGQSSRSVRIAARESRVTASTRWSGTGIPDGASISQVDARVVRVASGQGATGRMIDREDVRRSRASHRMDEPVDHPNERHPRECPENREGHETGLSWLGRAAALQIEDDGDDCSRAGDEDHGLSCCVANPHALPDAGPERGVDVRRAHRRFQAHSSALPAVRVAMVLMGTRRSGARSPSSE
jgi:hypothetical protein